MSKSRNAAVLAVAMALIAAVSAAAFGPAFGDEHYGLGAPASSELIAGWDIDVRPDGQGLPPGQGTAAGGEETFVERCAACHGEFGEAVGRYPVLIGGGGSLASADPVKTVGSYWPYAATLWDYIHRAMPFGDAQSLSVDETYAVTAYVLFLNDLVDEDFVLDRDSLPTVEMPNRGGFIDDDPRPDTPVGEPCMTDCKAEAKVMFKAKRLNVTPESESN